MNKSPEPDPELPKVDPIILGDTVVITFYNGTEDPVRIMLVHDRCTTRVVLKDALKDDPNGLSEILKMLEEDCPELPELALDKSDYEIPLGLLERFTELMLHARIACSIEESDDAADIINRRYQPSSRLLVEETSDDGSMVLLVFVTTGSQPIVTIIRDPETRDHVLAELELLLSPKELTRVRNTCEHIRSTKGAGSYRGSHVLASMLALGYQAKTDSDEEPEHPIKQRLS